MEYYISPLELDTTVKGTVLLYKLDGVGPVGNRPSTTSSTPLGRNLFDQ